MSPGKCISPPPVLMAGKKLPSSAHKSLNFGSTATGAAPVSPNVVLSWADKVKGLKNSPVAVCTPERIVESDVAQTSTSKDGEVPNASSTKDGVCEEIDNSGWEVVSRGKHRSRGSSTSLSLKTCESHDSVEEKGSKNDRSKECIKASPSHAQSVVVSVSSAFEIVDKSPVYSASMVSISKSEDSLRTDESQGNVDPSNQGEVVCCLSSYL